jgi:hypothetical protein
MDDYRIRVGWRGHPKRIKLERRLGAVAVLALMDLWEFCTSSRTDGDLSGMDDEDIAIAAGYAGNASEWVGALVSFGLLVRTKAGVRVHDWKDHNPYVAGHKDRSEAARAAVNERWKKAKQSKSEDTPTEEGQYGSYDSVLPPDTNGNTPSPSPSPSPSPDPIPSPEPRREVGAVAPLTLSAPVDVKAKKSRKVAVHPMPATWAPNATARAKAREMRLDPDREAEKFRHWTEAGGKQYASWDAAFLSHLDREVAPKPFGGGPRSPPTAFDAQAERVRMLREQERREAEGSES